MPSRAESDGVLLDAGAVGDICHRVFRADGSVVHGELDDRIIAIPVADLLRVPRRVGVAGGTRKLAAIKGAMAGGWVTALVTDLIDRRAAPRRLIRGLRQRGDRFAQSLDPRLQACQHRHVDVRGIGRTGHRRLREDDDVGGRRGALDRGGDEAVVASARSPAATAAKAPSITSLSISGETPASAARSRISAVVGVRVVLSVASTVILDPIETAWSAMASSMRSTGMPTRSAVGAARCEIDEHVSITRSAPALCAAWTRSAMRSGTDAARLGVAEIGDDLVIEVVDRRRAAEVHAREVGDRGDDDCAGVQERDAGGAGHLRTPSAAAVCGRIGSIPSSLVVSSTIRVSIGVAYLCVVATTCTFSLAWNGIPP